MLLIVIIGSICTKYYYSHGGKKLLVFFNTFWLLHKIKVKHYLLDTYINNLIYFKPLTVYTMSVIRGGFFLI